MTRDVTIVASRFVQDCTENHRVGIRQIYPINNECDAMRIRRVHPNDTDRLNCRLSTNHVICQICGWELGERVENNIGEGGIQKSDAARGK